MSYTYDILIDDPVALWSFNAINSGESGDSSGYGNKAYLSGDYNLVLPIVARGGNSLKLHEGSEVQYELSGFLGPLLSGKSYSCDLWIRAEDFSEASIISRGINGLFINEGSISLRLGQYELVYDMINDGDVYHVSFSYDQDGAFMHVNAILAGVLEFEEPLELTSTGSLITEVLSGSITIDEVAVYNVSATYEKIGRHYLAGTDYVQINNVAASNGGQSYTFTDFDAEVYDSEMFFDEESWSLGLFDETVSITEEGISNSYNYETEGFFEGHWFYDYSVDPDDGYIAGSKVEWSGTGAILVEYSMDGGSSWSAIQNGGQSVGVNSIENGLSVTYRITLGTDNAKATVDNFIVTLYSSRNMYGTDEVNPAIPATQEYSSSSEVIELEEVSSGVERDVSEVYIPLALTAGTYIAFIASASEDFIPELSISSEDIDWEEISGAETELVASSVMTVTVYENIEQEIQINAKDYDEGLIASSIIWSIHKVNNYGSIPDTDVIVDVGSSGTAFLSPPKSAGSRAFAMMAYESSSSATSTTDIKMAVTHEQPDVGVIVVGDDSEFMTTLQASWGDSVNYSSIAFEIAPFAETVPPVSDNIVISDDSRITTSFSNNSGISLSEGIKTTNESFSSVEVYIRPEAGGFDLINTGSISASVDSSGNITSSGTSSVYVNGELSSELSIKDWSHVVITFPSQSGIVYIGAGEEGVNPMTGNIGYLSLYEDELTESQAKSLFDSATGMPGIQVAEESFGTLRDSEFIETGTAFRAYSYDWSSTPS